MHEQYNVVSDPPGLAAAGFVILGCAMPKPAPRVFARTVDGKVEVVFWRLGSGRLVPVEVNDPLALAADLVAAYRETINGRPDLAVAYARAAGSHPTRED